MMTMKTPPVRSTLKLIDRCASTSSELDRSAPHGFALMAREQTAGRGQRGNSWEAEPGMNITMSVMLRPEQVPAIRQFEISEAVALAVADTVEALGVGNVAVKWPNDIYVGDRKIAGILIENTLSGNMISRSVAGIGVNVNQKEFHSDAPNPVSAAQLTGQRYDLQPIAAEMVDRILARLGRDNHAEYRRRLWRGSGLWTWKTPDGREFQAEIIDVAPDGMLTLSGQPRPFAFKEVAPKL